MNKRPKNAAAVADSAIVGDKAANNAALANFAVVVDLRAVQYETPFTYRCFRANGAPFMNLNLLTNYRALVNKSPRVNDAIFADLYEPFGGVYKSVTVSVGEANNRRFMNIGAFANLNVLFEEI